MQSLKFVSQSDSYESFLRLTSCNNVSSLQQQLVVVVCRIFDTPTRLYQGRKKSDGLDLVALKENSRNKKAITEISQELSRRYQTDLQLLLTLPRAIQQCNFRVLDDQTVFFLRNKTAIQIFLICDAKLSEENCLLVQALMGVYSNLFSQMQYSLTDGLTGLLNRHAYEERLSALYHRYQSQNLNRRSSDQQDETACCFAFVDVDRFKSVNDCYGHLCGDEVLVMIAQIMRQFFREEDLVFRYGGEEFVIILMNSGLASSLKVLERFRKTIEKQSLPNVGKVTVSVGYTSLKKDVDYNEIARQADAALYYCKEHGRNAVACYETLVESEAIDLRLEDADSTG